MEVNHPVSMAHHHRIKETMEALADHHKHTVLLVKVCVIYELYFISCKANVGWFGRNIKILQITMYLNIFQGGIGSSYIPPPSGNFQGGFGGQAPSNQYGPPNQGGSSGGFGGGSSGGFGGGSSGGFGGGSSGGYPSRGQGIQ